MPQETLRQFMESGVSVTVATVDADGVPTGCRGIAVRSRDNFETITLYLAAATAQEMIANIATTRRVAVGCSKPLTHESIQIKGITRAVRLAPPEDEAFVRDRLHGFADVLDEIGLPRRITAGIAHWPAFAIDISVEQVFDQTPGPRAGNAIA